MAHQQQRPCLVLYGSATGNSEEIARAISEDAANYGIETSSSIEWRFVSEPDAAPADSYEEK